MRVQASDLLTYVFTIVWYCIALAAVSAALYLFLQGSSVFSWNRERIAARVHVEPKKDQLFVTGSVTPINPCVGVHMVESVVPARIELVSTPRTICGAPEDRQPVTFVVELPPVDPQTITITFDGSLLPIHFQ